MGKTNRPLKLLVHRSIYGTKEFGELLAKGHTIHPMTDEQEAYHGILGPKCWMMDETLIDENMLEVFLKACRKWSTEPKSSELQQPSLPWDSSDGEPTNPT